MSAIFKNAKKKLSQSELRKFMNDHKLKVKDTKKIESPLAKYPFITLVNTSFSCFSAVRNKEILNVFYIKVFYMSYDYITGFEVKKHEVILFFI